MASELETQELREFGKAIADAIVSLAGVIESSHQQNHSAILELTRKIDELAKKPPATHS